MKPHQGSPACCLVLSYAGMMCLAIAVNLVPVILTTLSVDLGGAAGFTNEQLGRIVAATFVGLVVGILLGARDAAGLGLSIPTCRQAACPHGPR